MKAKTFLPPANEVWGKVIFSHECVSHSVHRGIRPGGAIPGGVPSGGVIQGGSMKGGAVKGVP